MAMLRRLLLSCLLLGGVVQAQEVPDVGVDALAAVFPGEVRMVRALFSPKPNKGNKQNCESNGRKNKSAHCHFP